MMDSATDKASRFYRGGLMDLSAFAFARVELDETWDTFVRSSPQGTIFHRAAFLSALPFRKGLWKLSKGNEIKALVTTIESDDGKSCQHVGHVVHTGILFPPALGDQVPVDRLHEEFKACVSLIEHLSEQYTKVDFTNYVTVQDLRPFLWHNYGTGKPPVAVDIRYTSILDIGDPDQSWEGRLQWCNSRRRRSIRSGYRDGIRIEKEEFDEQLFRKLYRSTFESQQISIPEADLDLLVGIVYGLKRAGLIQIYVARDEKGDAGSVLIFGIDDERAFYLYGGNDRAICSAHMGSLVFWEAFRDLQTLGVRSVDLEGVNSPERGYFKLSFGGSLAQYSRVRWES